MHPPDAVTALAALGDDLRLSLYRLLVQRGPEGHAAGEIGARLDLAPSNLSFHLRVLADAGLITARRDGRYIVYAANFERMNALVGYLTENCCALGSTCAPECAPTVAADRAPAGAAACSRSRTATEARADRVTRSRPRSAR